MELWTSPTPNGWKINIMIEELIQQGIDLPNIKIKSIDLQKGEQFSEEFVKRNPNQKIPVLIDGEKSIMESGAILQYLAEKYPTSLLPADDSKWDVLPWVYWQVANLGPVFGNKLSYTRYMDDVEESLKSHPLERFGNEANRLLKVMDGQLSKHKFICSDNFTIADIATYPWVRGWKWSKINITKYQRIEDWLKRVRARPAVERGLAYGVPKEEIDQWSEERKARYASSGSNIASNKNLDRN